MLERLGHIPPAEAEKAYYASIVSANNAGWNDKAVQEIVRIPLLSDIIGADTTNIAAEAWRENICKILDI
ncbi:hypothetical protein AB54_2102 [Escherichia coli 2-011-08_S1_C3]|nr:hypothetical protein AB54_2102 [Escherichia coli 2-011-08_S1_C3]HAW6235288.1 hypothetical protein [Escherichia coli]